MRQVSSGEGLHGRIERQPPRRSGSLHRPLPKQLVQGRDPSDGDLVVRTLTGDATAFADLMRRYRPQVYGVIFRRIRNPDEAEDLVQETCLRTWRALDRYDPARPFAPWIVQIALNQCRDYARSLASFDRARRHVPLLDADGAPDGTVNIETAHIARQSWAHVCTALGTLPPQLREPLLLSCMDELSHREVADQLHVSVKTVEMRVYRARKKLTLALVGYGDARE